MIVRPERNMACGRLVAACLAILVGSELTSRIAHGQTPDRVRLLDRSEISGEIVSASPNDIEIKDQRTEEVKKVPVDRIREVALAGEPDSLRNARGMLLRGDAASAIQELTKVEQAELDGASDRVLAEMQFVKAAALARQATLTGTSLAEGEKALRDFVSKNPKTHHFYRAAETLGDLLAKAQKYPEATTVYAALEKGPPAMKVRAASAKANLFFSQGKYAEALKEFENASKVQTDPKDGASAQQKLEASLGTARCLGRLEKGADAIAMVQQVVKAADPEERDMLSKAYTVLGDAFRAAGKDQDALIAFLTVDLVYNNQPESHAEALFNLAQLWEKAQNPERARQAKADLEKTYPDSPWLKMLAGGGK
jgi:TolA-binding protein